jgi:hypothetical protein
LQKPLLRQIAELSLNQKAVRQAIALKAIVLKDIDRMWGDQRSYFAARQAWLA